jgi:hypothetical protein
MSLRPHLTPIGLLVLPLLAMNIIVARYLPPAYQPEVFWAAIPPVIGAPENILRTAMFALAFFLPLRHRRAGWALYLAGAAVYVGSWVVQIIVPHSALATSALGFTAPAWTAGLWLAGLALLAAVPVVSPRRVWIVVYWGLSAGFLTAHIAHAGLVWTRL